MEAMTYVLDDRTWTKAERDALPDDGFRYELIDGALVVTPAPVLRHQAIVVGLVVLLSSVRTPGTRVFTAPTDVELAEGTVLQPDVLVVRDEGVKAAHIQSPPLLAIEVLSPSTQVIDRNLKKQRFEVAKVPSYWLVEPDGPTLTAYELDADGHYQLVAEVTGDDEWTATAPFPVTIRPADLLS